MSKTSRLLAITKEIDNFFAEGYISDFYPFWDEFVIAASYHSNAIEGNTFTYDETRLLLEKGIVTGAHSLRESEDIAGYKEALDYLYENSKKSVVIDENFIKKIHSFVLKGDEEGGQYRKIQNYIGDGINIVYMPPDPEEISILMRDYTNELSKDVLAMKEIIIAKGEIPWVELFHMLAKHHIELEKIHPFIDGNGRVGRLLLVYEMIYFGLLPIDVRYENRARYYAAFSSYEAKKKYSTRRDSKTEAMAKLFAESELSIMKEWLLIFASKTN